jgi:hypothetical protein
VSQDRLNKNKRPKGRVLYKAKDIVTYSGVLFTKELYCTPKSQYTTVKHSRQLFEHMYMSDPHGLGTLTSIESFQQDLLWLSSNTHSHSCSQKASKHTRSIRRWAIGPLAHNSTSAYSPSLTCTSPDDRMSSSSAV